MNREPVVRLQEVTKVYGQGALDLNALRGLSFSTHDPRVMERAQRIVRLVDGRVVNGS